MRRASPAKEQGGSAVGPAAGLTRGAAPPAPFSTVSAREWPRGESGHAGEHGDNLETPVLN